MLRKMICCAAFVVAAMSATTLSAQTWNFNSDYSTTSPTLVNGVWTYGYLASGVFATDSVCDAHTDYGQPSGTIYRWVWKSGDSDTNGSVDKSVIGAGFGNYNLYWEPNATYLMPGMAFSGNPVAVRWTAPASGTYAVSSFFGSSLISGDNNPNYVVGVKLDAGSSYVWSDTINGFMGSAAANYTDANGTHPTTTLGGTLALTAGQTLDFIVNNGGGGGSNLRYTNFNATITAVPEPSTLALLAGGLVGLMAYAWRKRK